MRSSPAPSMIGSDMTVGRIHSVESFGTVDGPGIRYVLFLQGCPMRCLYCHNPDTWNATAGQLMTVDEVLEQYRKNAAFYQKGGITVTGGEPLLQLEFLTELFRRAKQEGIHTCLDTSGICYRPNDPKQRALLEILLQNTDLVLLDIKHIDGDMHKKLTGHSNEAVLQFARLLAQKSIPVWIRHVVLSGYTDDPESLHRLGGFLATLSNVKALDVLPYHTLGVRKYEELGIPYPLKDLPPLSQNRAEYAKREILSALHAARRSSVTPKSKA